MNNRKLFNGKLAIFGAVVWKQAYTLFMQLAAEELSQDTKDRIMDTFNRKQIFNEDRINYVEQQTPNVMRKIYLDDKRMPEESVRMYGLMYDTDDWVVVRNIDEFKKEIMKEMPDIVSLDHDLSIPAYRGDYSGKDTGYDALHWLYDYCDEYERPAPIVKIHSMSVEGRERMQVLVNTWEKMIKIF